MPKPENGARKRILVVEDDADLRDLITGRLTRAGYECVGAADGAKALECITAARPDALLLDQKLPDMTGRQLLENLAELGFEVPFMVMTGQGDERLAVEMMKLGAADYLVKDTQFLDVLSLAVEKLFRLADMERELHETRNNLLKSEELHRKLLTTVPDLIIQTDLNGHITFVNEQSFSNMKYVPRETLHGRDMLSFIAEKDLTRARENTGKMFEHALGPQEYQLSFEDGTTLDAEVNGDVIYDAQGQPTGMVYVIRDITERKRAEEALRESKQFVETLLGAIPVAVFFKDRQGRYLGCNEVFTQVTGLTAAEISGKTACDLWPSELSQTYHEKDLELLKTRQQQFYEFEVRDKDGSTRPVIFAKDVFLDADGNPAGIVGAFVDITERKTAEDELKASERRARLQRAALSDLALNQVFAEGDVNAAFRLIARLLTETLDVSRASIWFLNEDELKLNCITLYESDKDAFSSEAELNASEIPQYFKAIMAENRIYAEDAQNDPRTSELTPGYLKPLGISSLLDAGIVIEGRLKGVVSSEHIGPVRKWYPDEEAFISNVSALVAQLMANTQRKRAEEALQEERERLEHILSITGTGIDIVDGDFNLHFVDKGWQKIYGDPSGRKCYEYFNGLNEPCPECGIPIALETKQITVTEEVLPRENNRIVEVHIIPFQNAEGQWLVAEFNVDITNRKRVEAEKDKLQAQLIQAQKMESVGRLAGGVAHDFNNMLGVILGQAELALLKLEPGEPLHQGLAEIQKAARHSADLVKQLLAFARKQTISPRPLNLNDTLEGMLNMMRRLIGEDIELLWKPGRDLWPVEIDPVQVDQILANLCVNARDAISGLGKITIETDRVVFDHEYCSRHPGFVPGEFVLLAVSDNGCGMDSETLARLFEPFFTTKEVGRGTGLGLASVYGAVKQNQGFINVYSEPGRGSTFKIYLPRHRDQTARSKENPAPAPAERGTETILLVEDEPMILEVTRTMLEMLGYSVLTAGTPGEALRLAREYKGWIHLLMTDVVMPEMNGRDLAGKLLSLFPGIKRLFMSGYTANVIAHHGILDEGVHFIQKPFSMESLGAKLGQALERK